MLKNKIATTISTLLIIATLLVSIPTITAADDAAPTLETYAYIGATPNPVGVGQETLLHFGITQQYLSLYDGWKGLTITVTDPDGKNTTLGPFNTDPTGGAGTIYVPKQAGNYTLQTHFPEQVNDVTQPAIFGIYVPEGTIMKASDSRVLTLVVQEESTPVYPGQALPSEYWSRPVDAQLREWAPLMGNWQRTPDNIYAVGNEDAPETAHILWSNPLVEGGIVGAETGDKTFTTGDAYQGQWANSAIMNGILYYNTYPAESGKGHYPIQQIKAVDLRTGEELWTKNDTRLSFGQLIYVDTMNMHGAYPYIWSTSGTTWTAYDALNGEFCYSMYGVPSGVTVTGPNNEILIYTVSSRGYMTCWNSTTVVNVGDGTYEFGRYWNPGGSNYNASQGYMWNITIPAGLTGAAYAAIDDKIVGQSLNTERAITWALDLNPDSIGRLLYNTTWTAPADWSEGNQTISRAAGSIENGLIAIWSKETQQFWGISTDTGKCIWGPTPAQDYLDFFSARAYIVEGKLISQGMSGIAYCYDAQTAELLWTYRADDYYNQNLWSNQWNIRPLFFTDGKLYMGTSEHSPVDPKPRGAPFVCIEIENGTEVFRADGLFRQTEWGGRAIIGDGIIAALDTYDGQIYAIGKGPTAMTVNAPDVSVDSGKSIIIKGTITDISTGTQDYTLAARFPNGVPAVSDVSMSDWMLYVYKNVQRPTNATGVDITLSVLDANGNYCTIGTTTANADGFYTFNWQPDIEGTYTLYANFAGSKSYYASHAVTSFAVDPAPITPTPQPTQAPTAADLYFVPAIAGLLIAIIVVGLVTILMLRKHS